jgi:hypothetical protein
VRRGSIRIIPVGAVDFKTPALHIDAVVAFIHRFGSSLNA